MKLSKLKLPLLLLAAAFTLIGFYLAFIWAPTHESMGDVQRIFYFHVASAWVSYVAFAVTFAASLVYLKTKKFKWDTWAYSSATLGIIFCTIAITTGPLWAGAVWRDIDGNRVFWRWEDMKLFITLVLWLTFIAYFALRTNVQSRSRKANLSAVFGIIGVICIPLSFAANRIWVQYHPTIIATDHGSISSEMGMVLGLAVVAFTFLYLYLLLAKVEIEFLKEDIEELKLKLGD